MVTDELKEKPLEMVQEIKSDYITLGDLAKSIGWEPHISLEEGLTLTIDYFRKVIGKNYLTVDNPFN